MIHTERWFQSDSLSVDRVAEELWRELRAGAHPEYLYRRFFALLMRSPRMPNVPVDVHESLLIGLLNLGSKEDLPEVARKWVWDQVILSGWTQQVPLEFLARRSPVDPQVTYRWEYTFNIDDDDYGHVREVEAGSISSSGHYLPNSYSEQVTGLYDLVESMTNADRSFPWRMEDAATFSTYGYSARYEELDRQQHLQETEHLGERWEVAVLELAFSEAIAAQIQVWLNSRNALA